MLSYYNSEKEINNCFLVNIVENLDVVFHLHHKTLVIVTEMLMKRQDFFSC